MRFETAAQGAKDALTAEQDAKDALYDCCTGCEGCVLRLLHKMRRMRYRTAAQVVQDAL